MLRNKNTKEILKKIRKIEIKTSKIVNDLFSGQYTSIFKGRGMEFGEVREYQFGDDIRNIDWNVTARTGKTYIKKYIEERELTVMLVIDMSLSMRFGNIEKFKIEIAAEIASIFAFSAIKNNDKVGLLIFTDTVEKFIPPNKGRQHILRIIREILFFSPNSQKTNMSVGMKYITDILKRQSIIFFISDFIGKAANSQENFDNINHKNFYYEKEMQILNKKHDLINIYMYSNLEKELPKIGFISLKDNETGEILEFNTNNKGFRKKFAEFSQKNDELFKKFCNRNGFEFIDIEANESYIEPILKFFKKRSKQI
jgi:uncharacterized protein (DUF58 family)